MAADRMNVAAPLGLYGLHKSSGIIEQTSRSKEHIREKAISLGADVAGMTSLNRTWLRKNNSLKSFPDIRFRSVIVTGIFMDRPSFRHSPSPEIYQATCKGYRELERTAAALGAWLAGLGFNALSAGNSDSLTIPQAIEAGLGKYGRNGMLLNDRAGSCLRIGKVFTDLSFEYDAAPDCFLHEWCFSCTACAEACPAGAIEKTDRLAEERWLVDACLCTPYWNSTGKQCAACISACPLTWSDKNE